MYLNSTVLSWQRNRATRLTPTAAPLRSTKLAHLREQTACPDRLPCIEKYRLDPEGIDFFAGKLESLAPSTKAGISVTDQVKIALDFYASGASMNTMKNTYGLAQSTIYNIIVKVSKELKNVCLEEFVSFPGACDPWKTILIKEGFLEYGGFPSCLGAIDGTQIKIRGPVKNEEIYVNRKGDHAINAQFVCDMNMVIRACTVKWPGSVHDSTVWRMCSLNTLLTSSSQTGWLIGDSGYPLRERLIVPFLVPLTAAERKFNKALKKCRCVIERVNGVVKSRFRCLDGTNTGGLQFDPEVCCCIIASCVVLHNYCRMRALPDPEILPHILEEIRREERAEEARAAESALRNNRPNEAVELAKGVAKRDLIVAQYFT